MRLAPVSWHAHQLANVVNVRNHDCPAVVLFGRSGFSDGLLESSFRYSLDYQMDSINFKTLASINSSIGPYNCGDGRVPIPVVFASTYSHTPFPEQSLQLLNLPSTLAHILLS